jgi:tRNA threonylcarbamoyladenosine biosynthesis protein TsaE
MEFVRPGTVVVLRGELGAGKTQFAKGVAHACGVSEDELTSPTFALANEYQAYRPDDPGVPLTLIHLDCYRFEKPEELLELGVEDYLYNPTCATLVEWPERIEQFLPKERIEVIIEVLKDDERKILITT